MRCGADELLLAPDNSEVTSSPPPSSETAVGLGSSYGTFFTGNSDSLVKGN